VNNVINVTRSASGLAYRVELNADGIILAFRKDSSGKVISAGRRKGAHINTGCYVPRDLYAKVFRQAHGVLKEGARPSGPRPLVSPKQLGLNF